MDRSQITQGHTIFKTSNSAFNQGTIKCFWKWIFLIILEMYEEHDSFSAEPGY